MKLSGMWVALLAAALWACGSSSGADGDGGAGDRDFGDCVPTADDDGDCISNTVEGCGLDPEPDRDNDGLPDYFDADADGDGVNDAIEAGDCASPVDSDDDGLPDYQDTDSDNDGVTDDLEDRDGDGQLGTCTDACAGAGDCAEDMYCSMPRGVCVSPACLDGETDPHSTDTDGDGTPDGLEGTFICNPQSEDNPNGLKRIKYVDVAAVAQYANANWKIALEIDAQEGVPAINTPDPLESAYMFDNTGADQQVAGFLVSRSSGLAAATDESTAAIAAIAALPEVTGIIVRVSGTSGTTLDGHDTVRATTLQVTTSAPTTPTALRAKLYPALLGRPPGEVFVPDAAWGDPTATSFAIVFQTVRRADPAQLLYMGAVARLADFDDRTKATGFHADDLANGTALAESGNGEAIECEQFIADQPAVADIVWVLDGSGSMADDRDRVAAHATAFFDKAIAAGLDFRMGVTDMTIGLAGIFSTRQAGGTGDRWILPTEAALFATSVADPSGPDTSDGGAEFGLTQGRAALTRHLPRDDADPQHVREQAKIVVIYMSDEKPDEVENDLGFGEGNENYDAAMLASLLTYMATWIADFTANDAIAHAIVVPLPFTEPPCSTGGAETGWGYFELVNATGGQIGSICQSDLGATLDAIIDNVLGEASPIVLSYVPISATVAVARDDVAVPRSREVGFDYRASSNSIVFFNMPFDPDNPSDVVVSYRRWAEQVPIE